MTLHLNLPPEVLEKLQRRAAEAGHGTLEQYAEALILADVQDNLSPELEQALLEGIASGPPTELPPGFWTDLKRRRPGTAQK